MKGQAMNTREKRLQKLETLIKEKQVERGHIVLYNEFGKRVDGVVIIMPTVEAEGVARLTDGTKQGIVYESDWNHKIDIFIIDGDDKIMFMDNEAIDNEKDIDLTGKLVIRKSTCEIVMMIPASKVMLPANV